MEDEELVKMFNPTLKMKETILFFSIVVINGLTWIVSDIGLNTCARGRWLMVSVPDDSSLLSDQDTNRIFGVDRIEL